MNQFEKALIDYIGEDNLTKIQSYKVGIGGAGGLGSNCAFNLVRSGFDSFVMADFDIIEFSNLDRQFYFYDQVGLKKVHVLEDNLLRINPGLDIKSVEEEVTEENIGRIFDGCDIIIEAFDNVDSKKLIVEKYMNSDKLLVSATGLAGWGKSDDMKTRKVNDTFYLVGDFVTGVSEDNPPISPRVNIAAAKQADIVLTYVLEGDYE